MTLRFLAALASIPVLTFALHFHRCAINGHHEVDGFELQHTYTVNVGTPHIVKHKIVSRKERTSAKSKFIPQATANVSQEPFTDQYSKISTFLKMNTNAYPPDRRPPEWWLQSAFEPLYGPNQTHFPDRPDELPDEIRWRDSQYRAFADSVGLSWPITSLPIGGEEDKADIGLAVSVYYSKAKKATVIVFRGTFSYTNFEDIALWYGRDWIYYRWRDLILHDWRDVLGMPVTEDTLKRGSGLSEWFYNGFLWHVMRHMRRRLAHRISLLTDASPDEIDQQGYWPVLKQVVREILAGRSRRELGKVYLTGHSKGGALASQVSMWLAKEFGTRYETYAMEPTGYQCWINSGLQADIDLTDPHLQIVTYRDVLGHYSRLDYQIGRVYTYGIDQSRIGLNWCERVVGYPGAQLFVHPVASLDAARCRYFHHDTHAMVFYLIRPSSPYVLSSTGVPKGHFTFETVPGIPLGDQRCPRQAYGLDFGLLSWLMVFFLLPIIGGTLFFFWFRRVPTKRPLSSMEALT